MQMTYLSFILIPFLVVYFRFPNLNFVSNLINFVFPCNTNSDFEKWVSEFLFYI